MKLLLLALLVAVLSSCVTVAPAAPKYVLVLGVPSGEILFKRVAPNSDKVWSGTKVECETTLAKDKAKYEGQGYHSGEDFLLACVEADKAVKADPELAEHL